MELTGQSFLGNARGASDGAGFQAANPQTGELLPPVYYSASAADVNAAAELAAEAFGSYSHASGRDKAAFLRRVADSIDEH
jgi:alpha-ketoglutaric semialdehyde dehydrogenase